jgi:hypothetical protein
MDKNLFMHLSHDLIILTQINVYFLKLVIYILKKKFELNFQVLLFKKKKL